MPLLIVFPAHNYTPILVKQLINSDCYSLPSNVTITGKLITRLQQTGVEANTIIHI